MIEHRRKVQQKSKDCVLLVSLHSACEKAVDEMVETGMEDVEMQDLARARRRYV